MPWRWIGPIFTKVTYDFYLSGKGAFLPLNKQTNKQRNCHIWNDNTYLKLHKLNHTNNCIAWAGVLRHHVNCWINCLWLCDCYCYCLSQFLSFDLVFFPQKKQRQLCPIGRDKSWCPGDELVQFSPKLHTSQAAENCS